MLLKKNFLVRFFYYYYFTKFPFESDGSVCLMAVLAGVSQTDAQDAVGMFTSLTQ